MGNRAHVIFTNADETSISPAIYLHWNGGPESVYAFLAELDRRGIRADQEYDAARFAAIVGQFFDQDYYSDTSLGIKNGPDKISAESLVPYDHGDNGIYVVNRDGGPPIVRRFFGNFQTGKVKEISREEVNAEATEARESEQYAGIVAYFADDGKPVGYAAYSKAS